MKRRPKHITRHIWWPDERDVVFSIFRICRCGYSQSAGTIDRDSALWAAHLRGDV